MEGVSLVGKIMNDTRILQNSTSSLRRSRTSSSVSIKQSRRCCDDEDDVNTVILGYPAVVLAVADSDSKKSGVWLTVKSLASATMVPLPLLLPAT